jgi:hypothetical protein
VKALALVVVVGCGSSAKPMADAGTDRAEVGLMRPSVSHDVDVLFVIDDGPASILDKQNNLKNNFPALLDVLNELPGGFPNVHLGVVTTDLGTSSQLDPPAPAIGTGAGMCGDTGKAGNLQTFGTTQITGNFISDIGGAGGQRQVNYAGTLNDAFTQIASAGANGCGFEQPIEAVHRALANNPANAGFLRDTATLAIITLTDEDDHSARNAQFFTTDTSVLGPLSDFRSTQWGVTCQHGGETPDQMAQPGAKSDCASNESSPYVAHLAEEVAFLHGVKVEPRDVLYAPIVGPATPVTVELRASPGSTTQVPAIANVCGAAIANPSVRITDFASHLPRSDVESTICQQDLSPALTSIARSIKNLLGEPCLVRDIAMPADCTVTDDTTGAPLGFTLTPDATTCPDGQHLRLALTDAPPGTWARVRCTLP